MTFAITYCVSGFIMDQSVIFDNEHLKYLKVLFEFMNESGRNID